jgi:hypothetical protein
MKNENIEVTKKLIQELQELLLSIYDIVRDGINFTDIFKLFKVLGKASIIVQLFRDAPQIKKELLDLDKEEFKEIGDMFVNMLKELL